jgi:hypothetical protein
MQALRRLSRRAGATGVDRGLQTQVLMYSLGRVVPRAGGASRPLTSGPKVGRFGTVRVWRRAVCASQARLLGRSNLDNRSRYQEVGDEATQKLRIGGGCRCFGGAERFSVGTSRSSCELRRPRCKCFGHNVRSVAWRWCFRARASRHRGSASKRRGPTARQLPRVGNDGGGGVAALGFTSSL